MGEARPVNRTKGILQTPLFFVVGALVLLIVGLLLGLQNERDYRGQRTNELRVQAGILSTTVLAALVFDDREATQESVDALRANPEIEIAAIFDESGAFVAGFARGGAALPMSAAEAEDAGQTGNRISVYEEIARDGTLVGSVYLRSLAEPAFRAFSRYIGLGLLTAMAVLLIAVFGYFAITMERANIRLIKQANDLEHANARLNKEMEERQRAEEALRHSQKMEAIGQLSGGIAHDFNNLLTIVSGNLQLARKRLQDAPIGIERYIEQALEGLGRASTLTQRILAFSRRQSLSPRSCDFNELVGNMMSLLRNSVDETVSMTTRLNSHWVTHCDASQMENAVLNLAINARDAMSGGGTLSIETADVTLEEPNPRYPDAPLGQYVELSVTDTGVGMSEEVRSKAIDPFFTTKPLGRGTGLGLSMVFGFVTQSGGFFSIESREGEGTRIGILLPRYGAGEGKSEARQQSQTAVNGETVLSELDPISVPGAPTILVVEDEALVRMLSVETLRDEGYNVLEARDGKEAVNILSSDVEIDLLLTDIKLPHLSGYEVVEQCAPLRPSMRVIFVTGYAGQPMSEAMRQAGMEIITKPYIVEDLVKLVTELLGAQPPLATSNRSRFH